MSGIPVGRLEGYQSWDGGTDPFEDHAGPFYFRKSPSGGYEAAFEAAPHHCNAHGSLHGGMLMTFADYSLFMIARDQINGFGVTISFNSEFIGTAGAGDFIEAKGDVVRETGSMVFVRGQIVTGARVLLNYSGIIKKVRG
ncbi:MAG: PaaI family thioesterase [Parvibaculaceae bacterium]|nr:PaaI family thioesterase [Parvibaculaceae bacterium]